MKRKSLKVLLLKRKAIKKIFHHPETKRRRINDDDGENNEKSYENEKVVVKVNCCCYCSSRFSLKTFSFARFIVSCQVKCWLSCLKCSLLLPIHPHCIAVKKKFCVKGNKEQISTNERKFQLRTANTILYILVNWRV